MVEGAGGKLRGVKRLKGLGKLSGAERYEGSLGA